MMIVKAIGQYEAAMENMCQTLSLLTRAA